MAIENDILIVANAKFEGSDGVSLNISHLDEENFPGKSFKIKSPVELTKPHTWVNYVLAGFNAVYDSFITEDVSCTINLLVTGNVPLASGLSSSSALTVASALCFVEAFELRSRITKNELALATINYERKVGTACGGMDQTISIYAERDQAKLIEFVPTLTTTAVTLPTDTTFIIANSLTPSAKINTLAFRYNKRVVENKFGLALICKSLHIPICSTLKELKTNLNIDYLKLHSIIQSNLKEGSYSLAEINDSLGDDTIKLILQRIPDYNDVLIKNTEYFLRDRLTHVCDEAERVEHFHKLCSSNSIETPSLLGGLMNQSHTSCKVNYDCSSVELNSLVDFCVYHGALGARLTGAGWGGCCVILAKNEDVVHLTKQLGQYYLKQGLLEEEIAKAYFVTKPSHGACIFKI